MATVRIRYGDEGYDVILAAWVENGRPKGTFDRIGFWGGAIYRVRTPEGVSWDGTVYPDFFQITSMGPTVIDDDTGKVTEDGWLAANQQDGAGIEVRIRDEPSVVGAPLIKIKHKDPPNDLTVAETVVES
jgi:hypothetical protein